MTDLRSGEAISRRDAFSRSEWLRLAAALGGLFAVFYFYELANFSFSIDEETALLRDDGLIWLQQGRWTCFLLEQYIFREPALPYFPILFYGACNVVSAIFLHVSVGSRDDRSAFLAFPLLVAFPTAYFIVDFSSNLFGYGVGLIAACASVMLLARQGLNRRTFVTQVVLVAIAVGGYQSFAAVPIVGAGIMYLVVNRHSEASSKRFVIFHLGFGGFVAGGIALSEIITRLMQRAFGVKPAFVGSYVDLENLLAQPIAIGKAALLQYSQIYTGDPTAYGYACNSIALVAVLGLVAVTHAASRRQMLWRIPYALGISFAPFLFNLAAGGTVPTRSLAAVPVLMFLTASVSLADLRPWRRIAAAVGCILFAIQTLYIGSIFNASKARVENLDRSTAAELYADIAAAIPGFNRSRQYHVDIFGSRDIQPLFVLPPSSTFNASFFAWDGGNESRMLLYMQALGYTNLTQVNGEERLAYWSQWNHMPLWPARNSVVYENGVIRVKLGSKPGETHKGLPSLPVNSDDGMGPWTVVSANIVPSSISIINANDDGSATGSLALKAEADSQLLIRFEPKAAAALSNCFQLRVEGSVEAENADTVQIFYATPEKPEMFHSDMTVFSSYPGSHRTNFDLIAESGKGFMPAIRLDPGNIAQHYAIRDLTISCR